MADQNALLEGVMDRTKELAIEKRERDMRHADMQAKPLYDAMLSPDISPEERQDIVDKIDKIYSGNNKSHKDILAGAHDLVSKLFGFMKAPPTEAAAQKGTFMQSNFPPADPAQAQAQPTPTPASGSAQPVPAAPPDNSDPNVTNAYTMLAPPVVPAGGSATPVPFTGPTQPTRKPSPYDIAAHAGLASHMRGVNEEITKETRGGIRAQELESARGAAQANVADIRANATVDAAKERSRNAARNAMVNSRKLGVRPILDPDGNMTGEFESIPENELTAEERAKIGLTKAQTTKAERPPNAPNPTAATIALKAAEGDQTAIRAMKFLKPDKAGEVTLTPEAIRMLGTQFAMTGTMPSLGMGGKTDREIIFNEAAEQLKGMDLATQKSAYTANQASLTALQKSHDAVLSFENTASKNLALFLASAKPIVDSGSPAMNTPLRLVDEKLLGSQDLAAYRAARLVALNEIARVTSNPNLTGAMSDNAREEVKSLIPENATLAQIYHVADVLTKDMANRRQSLKEQIDEVQKRIRDLKPTITPPPTSKFTVNYNGTSYVFPDQKGLDNFKRDMGIK